MFDDVNKFRDLRATRPLCEILTAHKYIISQIHLAQVQVCTNCGVLRKSVIFLAPLFILKH